MTTLERSRKAFERSRRTVAGGINSNVRASDRPFPLFFDRGKGSRIWDVDGNEYVDFVMGRGPLILGHTDPSLIEAVHEVIGRGQIFAGQTELEYEVAEAIRKHFPSMEMVRFANTGSEAIHATLRLARFSTGRKKIVKFEGHYHGWFDNIVFGTPTKGINKKSDPNEARGNSAASSEDVLVLPWNDMSALRIVFDECGRDIAAVVMEPIMCNYGCVMPHPGYLEGVRELCTKQGILLIFDEVITGFRMGLNGAQGHYGLTPDLTVLGKALAGGFVLSCFGGRRDLMDMIADLRVLHAGTFNGNPVSLAAAKATLRIMEERQGEFVRMRQMGNKLIHGLKKLAGDLSLPCGGDGPGSIFCFYLMRSIASESSDRMTLRDDKATALLQENLLAQGIRTTPEGTWLLSFAHDSADMELALTAAKRILPELVETNLGV